MAELITIPAEDLKKGMYLSILGRTWEIERVDKTTMFVIAYYRGDDGWIKPIRYSRQGDVEVVACAYEF